MGNLQKLRDIFSTEEAHDTPTNRSFGGEWVEVCIGIGRDHTAYITMPLDALVELLAITEDPQDDISVEDKIIPALLEAQDRGVEITRN